MTKAPLDFEKPTSRGDVSDGGVLDAVQQAAGLGYWQWEPSTGQLHCSDVLCRLLDCEAGESSPSRTEHLFQLVHPDDRQRVEFTIRGAMKDPSRPFSIQHRLVCGSSGEVMHVRHKGFVHCSGSEDGEPLLLATVQDITAEVADDKTESGEQDWLDTFVNAVPDLLGALPDIVVLKDGQGRWLVANEFTQNLFNLDSESYRFQTDYELAETSKVHHDAHLECARTDEIAWELGELSVQEESILTADGRDERIFETLKVPLFYDDGSRKALMVLGRDISERRRADSQNRRLGRILEDSYNEIYTVDLDTMKFIQVNRGARLNLGYTVEELREMTPADISENSKSDLHERVRPLIDGTQRLLTFEAVHIRKDGSRYPVELRLFRSHSEPNPVFVAIGQDISERKRIERIKNEFISVVSHELRTPLTPITGVLELLRYDPSLECDERTRKMIDVAHRNAQRLRRLIDQLLDFRALSLGRASFELRDLEMGDILRHVERSSVYLSERYDFEMQMDLPDEQLWVFADRRYLIQLFNILLGNAAKFSPPQGTVSISAAADGDVVCVAVGDQGPGIPEEMRAHIFDRFVQADSTATREYGGTGIGLSLAKLIVDNFGGEIYFECGEEGGTTFFVELPLHERGSGVQ